MIDPVVVQELVLEGRLDEAGDAVGADERGGDPDERFWLTQTGALRQIVAGDRDAFRHAIGDVRSAFEATHADEETHDGPKRLLELPILGLEALARERWPDT